MFKILGFLLLLKWPTFFNKYLALSISSGLIIPSLLVSIKLIILGGNIQFLDFSLNSSNAITTKHAVNIIDAFTSLVATKNIVNITRRRMTIKLKKYSTDLRRYNRSCGWENHSGPGGRSARGSGTTGSIRRDMLVMCRPVV